MAIFVVRFFWTLGEHGLATLLHFDWALSKLNLCSNFDLSLLNWCCKLWRSESNLIHWCWYLSLLNFSCCPFIWTWGPFSPSFQPSKIVWDWFSWLETPSFWLKSWQAFEAFSKKSGNGPHWLACPDKLLKIHQDLLVLPWCWQLLCFARIRSYFEHTAKFFFTSIDPFVIGNCWCSKLLTTLAFGSWGLRCHRREKYWKTIESFVALSRAVFSGSKGSYFQSISRQLPSDSLWEIIKF